MKFFNRNEFACRCGCGFVAIDHELYNVLMDIRRHFDCRVFIKSGNRCKQYNSTIQGASSTSKHVAGIAADIHVENVTPEKVYRYITTKYPHKYGMGIYDTWVHIDVRDGPARWDKRSKDNA